MNIRFQAGIVAMNSLLPETGTQRGVSHWKSAIFRQICVFTILLVPCSALAQSGGGYAITKSTISGGGTKSGGDYQLSGTVGQHSVSDLAGGSYSLKGGFWSPAVARPESPTADSSGLEKARFISFSVPAGTGGAETALRVTLTSLHHVVPPYTGGASVPFTSFEGQVRWVGPPAQYVESTGNPAPFQAASLQCTPHFQDWSTVGLLHVTGSAIIPSSVFEVENVAASCQGSEANCTAVSAPLTVATTRWADVEMPYSPPQTSGQPDFGDIAALVNKFKSQSGAPTKARALLAGDDTFGNISPSTMSVDFSFAHISACVDAFKGKPYPHTIQACP